MNKRKLILFFYLLISICVAIAQTKSVSGVVIAEEDGSPVIGASVQVKGTTLGTITDLNGRFSLSELPEGASALMVSYIGMKSQELPISPHMTITLKADAQTLDEVIVVAYGTAKKSSLTGAVSSVDHQAIEQYIGTSVTGALEGNAPGVQVNNTYGEPGASPKIRIRGIASVNGDNNPLFVVDGIPFDGSINDLNPSDIESMTVLKDAASAALYGNRAANGVILITTKNGGKEDRTRVTLSLNQGFFTRGIPEYKLMDADAWMEVQWKGLRNSRLSGNLDTDLQSASAYASAHLVEEVIRRNIYDAPDDQLFDADGHLTAHRLSGYDDTNWTDAVEQTGSRQAYDLSFSRGNDKYSLFTSLGYLDEKGYIRTVSYKRYTGRTNVSFHPVKWFKAGLNLSASSQKNITKAGVTENYYCNPFYTARFMAPIYPIYMHNSDGSYQLDANGNRIFDTTSDYLASRNIVYEDIKNWQKEDQLTVDATPYATLLFPYGLEATLKVSRYMNFLKGKENRDAEIGDGAAVNGLLYVYTIKRNTTNLQQQLNWSHEFGLHHVDAMAGHESYRYLCEKDNIRNTNQVIEGNFTLGNFTTNDTSTGYEDEDTTESYLARARYNYNSRYFFETSFRRDGSSRFSKKNRWGNFFSVGGAWDLSNERFIQQLAWVDFLKLRASYGEVGNNAVGGYYAYQSLYNLTKYAGSGALIREKLSAEDLRWETTQTVDIALDGHLLNRVNFSIGYFNKRSKDLLFEVKLPASAGSSPTLEDSNMTQLRNIGSIVNRGWECSVDVDILKKKVWKWNVGLDVTQLKNVVKKLPGGEEISNGNYRIAEGHSVYEFYMYHFVGVDQMTGRSLYTLDPTMTAEAESEGALVTINGTDYTTETDYGLKGWAGSAHPKLFGDIHSTLKWKDLSLNLLMTYSIGGKVYDRIYRASMMTFTTDVQAQHTDLLKSWNGVPEGMTEDSPNRIDPHGIPIIDNYNSYSNNAVSDRWLTSASYLVMKNIRIDYQLPKDWTQAWKLNEVSLNAGVENAFTLTARHGLNPQYDFNGSQDYTYTTARIFNLGLNIKF